ncbi:MULTISPECIES: type II toxin-antitoxin system RelE/ParE family toxin [Sphingomonas]|uniref:type II toxin-antitoxin system RelE/ParE family toxin n=1 Tax=Sphingomonas TaxID=13687 RepID=UPI001AE59A61
MTPVTISRDADADLDGILDYGIAAHGREIAEAYLRAIHAAFDRLSDFPELGVARGDLSAGLRSLPCGGHRIFYVVQADSVLIARVLHKAMDPTRYL